MSARADAPRTPLRLALGVAALLVVALGLPSRAADLPRALRVFHAPDGSAWVNVPVSHPKKNGPRSVAVRLSGLPAGVTTVTGTATPNRDSPIPKAPAGATANPEPAPVDGTDDAAQFPADAPTDPGTITSLAGGICDGYLATEATVTPIRVAVSNGTVWWLDDDGSMEAGSGHDRGSLLLRHLTADGRVRTAGPLLEPEEGRYARMFYGGLTRTALVGDGAGGVYVAVGYAVGGDAISFGGTYGDEPASTTILHVRADGSREVVAGGGKPPAVKPMHLMPGGEPALGAPLGEVYGMAVTPDGSLFVVEDAQQNVVGSSTIAFVNRGRSSVTFYPGTALSVAVRPGAVATIAGDLYTQGANVGFANGGGHGEGGSARKAQIPINAGLAYRRGFLYLLSPFQDAYAADPGQTQPTEVEAVNLGLDGGDTVAGVTIAEGNIDRLAGVVDLAGTAAVDGVPARAASFRTDVDAWHGGLAVAPNGDIVVGDTLHDRVRRIDGTTGIIRTVAGTGTYGYDGDGLVATSSRVAYPLGVAADTDGTVYFADVRNARVRHVTKDGRLVTVAGRGPTPCGDGHLATGRSLYGGMYIGEQHAVATDSHGRVFVADAQYAVIRRIGPGGRVEASVGVPSGCAYAGSVPRGEPSPCGPRQAAGDGGPFTAAHLGDPNFLAVDSYDNLFLTDGSAVRYVNFRATPVSVLGVTVAPGAIATVESFGTRSVHVFIPGFYNGDLVLPIGAIALDGDGSLYVADPVLYKVWKIDRCGRISTVAGSGVAPSGAGQGDGGPALSAALAPVGIAVDRTRRLIYLYDSGRSFIDSGSGLDRARIRVVNLATTSMQAFGVAVPSLGITTVAGGAVCSNVCSFGDGGPARLAAIGGNSGLVLSRDRLYFADADDNRIRVILPDGTVAGLAAPWPEARNGQGLAPGAPSRFGTRGDGGRALDAWVAVSRMDYNAYYEGWGLLMWPSVLSATLSGDLLVGDEGGRVRRIADPVHAPLRLSASVPALDDAGVGFSSPLVLRHPMPNAGDTLPGTNDTVGTLGDPDLVSYGGTSSLVGSLGPGAGCVLWTVTTNADGKGRDAQSAPAGAGTGGLVSPVGGRGCRVSGTSAAAVTIASTQDVRDGSGTRYEAALPVTTTADAGQTWRTTFADATRAGTADRGAVAIAGHTVVYRDAAAMLHAATTSDGVTFADTGSPGHDVTVLGNAVTSGPATYVAFAQAGRIVLSRNTSGSVWTATTVATVSPRAAVSPPSVAVGKDGTAYVTWSDGDAVYLASHGAVRRVNEGAGTLPGVAAGDAGEVVVAWYGTPEPRVKPDDPYARWYVYTARYTPASDRPVIRVASATPVHGGPFPDVSGDVTPSSAVGPVQVRVGTAGRAELAYRVDPGLGGNGSGVPAIGFLRACTGRPLVPAAPVPCTLNPPPARTVGDDIAPPPPAVPPVGNPILGGCSPMPPAFAEPPPPPAPRTRPAPRPGPGSPAEIPRIVAPGIVVGAVPPVPQAEPGEPDPIAGSENVTAAQNGTVAQPGYGAAPDEQEQAELVTAQQRDREVMGDVLAMSALMTAAAFGVAWRRRTQQEVGAVRPGPR